MRDRNRFMLTRRQVFRLAGAASVGLLQRRLSAQPPRTNNQGVVRVFLNQRQYLDLEAASARILPTDDLPGAREARVADYIQGMLSALPPADANCDGGRGAADFTAIVRQLDSPVDPLCSGADVNFDATISAADAASAEVTLFEANPIFAGCPFSGRQPFGDFENGAPTSEHPRNSFNDFLPLNRVQRLAWTVRLDGAAAVPEVAGNPLASELPDVDLRAKYRDGLNRLDQLADERFQRNFWRLTEEQQDEILAEIPVEFINLLTEHTIEGLLCDPVYGGNRDFVGWQLVGFDGDSQPLGYTIFDATAQVYRERPDKPNSTIDPDDPCAGFTPAMEALLDTLLVTFAGGEKFDAPFCFPGT